VRTRDARARAVRAALLVAVAGAGALVLLVERPGRVQDVVEREPELAQEREPRQSSVRAVPEPERVLVTPERAPAAAAAEAQADTARSEPALTELAALLDAPRTTRVQWDAAVRATAGSLADAHAPALLAAAGDPARPESVRVAAAELLRVRDEREARLALPGSALHALRTAAASAEPLPTRCAAACRALAWFGDAGDRLALVRALGDSTDPALAAAAGHGLRAAHAADVVPDLVGLALRGADEDAAGRALVTLIELAERQPWPEALRAEVAGAVQGAAFAPGSERELRALGLLVALDVHAAEAALLAAAQGAPEAARVAAGGLARADAHVRRELAGLLERTELPVETRLAAAEALVRGADAPADACRTAARAWLRAVAESDGDGSPGSLGARRRAVAALAGLGDPADREWLAALARSEEALALHALVPDALDSALIER
jgi:hypothetical protein